MKTERQWWGYLHTNHEYYVMNYVGRPSDQAMAQKRGSAHIAAVIGPFYADSRREAEDALVTELIGRGLS